MENHHKKLIILMYYLIGPLFACSLIHYKEKGIMPIIAALIIGAATSHHDAPPDAPPPSPDYSDAEQVESDNNKTTVEAQIMSQEFALQQSSLDHEMQNAAKLEQSLASFDTHLQTSKLDYFQNMKTESDKH